MDFLINVILLRQNLKDILESKNLLVLMLWEGDIKNNKELVEQKILQFLK